MDNIPSNNIWKYYEHDNPNILSRIEYFINTSDVIKSISNSFFKNSNYILFKKSICPK